MDSGANTYILPAVLDLRAAAQLKADLEARMGAAIALDASRAERLGGLCLQILIAAASAWRAASLDFRLLNAGEAFHNDVCLMNAAHLLPGLENRSGPPC
jgi:chemotaxis protein CheX